MTARRRVLAVTLVVASAATAVLAGGAAAQEAPVGVAAPGRMAFTFVGQIEQDGPLAVDVGYLTYVAGLEEEQLFTGTDPLARDESTARFTYFATARLERRSVNGNLFVTGGTAETALFFQDGGGADFADPTSFRRGTEIATFESDWHDVINVQAPDEGIALVQSDDTQRTATPFDLDGEPVVFGEPDAFVRLSFTGQGTRSQAEPPRATILYAGEATAVSDPPTEAPGDDDVPADDAAPAAGGAPGDDAAIDTTATSGWVWTALGVAVVALALSGASLALAARRARAG